jgi:alpha-tubulin N-acetyltransferase 1
VDRFGNSGKGSVVGLLKVGRKKLFLLDELGKPNEMMPQCVLDFYVTERRQRSGCGSRLFQHMLTEEQANPRWTTADIATAKEAAI